jgi:molecular chaperone GrpE
MKEENNQEIKIGIYRHYKNKKEYQILFFGKDSETKEDVVIYQALYGEQQIWVRSKEMFIEKIDFEGKITPRFELISEIIDTDKENFENKYKRALADYHNLMKQTAKEKYEFSRFANEAMIHKIIPVYDNLKMSILHHNKKDNDAWQEGVQYVIKQFKNILEESGVEEIKTIGEIFDHNIMEAINTEPTEEKEKDGVVAKEIKAGYILNGKVIIPARVVVYKVKK